MNLPGPTHRRVRCSEVLWERPWARYRVTIVESIAPKGAPTASDAPRRFIGVGHGMTRRLAGIASRRGDGIVRSGAGIPSQPESDCHERAGVIRRGDGIVRFAAGSISQRGFTLLEIVLVMALIAITGVLALGVLTGGFDRMLLRSSAKEMTAQLRFARAHAIATGIPQRFEIDPQARTWRSADERAGELSKKLGVHFIGAREVQPAEGVGAIVFFGDGASTGGRVQLSLRDAAWNVDVAWLTGEVTLHRGEVAR